MKANTLTRKRPKSVLAIAAAIFLAVTATGVVTAYAKLRDLWLEQCIVTDVAAQATCTDGKMVKGGTILDQFGIRNGANLALIDFDAKRQEILRQIPNIRAIAITRYLPNRIAITVEERRPIVRMGVHGVKQPSGRVADAEGVVFTCRRGTSMLPTIREKESAVTPVGQRLSGRSLAALQLAETAADTEFSSLGILDIDTVKLDFLLATLGNYHQAKIAWEGMDSPSESTRPQLVRRLTQLTRAIKSNCGADATVWNATEDNRIYADTQDPIQ